MNRCVFEGQDRLRTAPCPGRWLTQLQLWRRNDPDLITTDDVPATDDPQYKLLADAAQSEPEEGYESRRPALRNKKK